MATVVGVRFREVGKIYSFDPGDLVLRRGDHVIAETSKGYEYGTVVLSNHPDNGQEEDPERKRIIRRATEEDEKKVRDNKGKEKDALLICRKKVDERKLEMKVIAAEYTFDDSKLLFFFTADGRVDFRDLVKDLAAIFHMRIELRQVGVRDETRIIGGMGPCGRALCCHSWLPDFVPVSIKMAKEQNLSLNPQKISGVCGRLMCCLKNEAETYAYLNSQLPKKGDLVELQDGRQGEIVEVNVIRQTVRVFVILDDDEREMRDVPASETVFIAHRKKGQPSQMKKDAMAKREAALQEAREREQNREQAKEQKEQKEQAREQKERFRNRPPRPVEETWSDAEYGAEEMNAGDAPEEGKAGGRRSRRRPRRAPEEGASGTEGNREENRRENRDENRRENRDGKNAVPAGEEKKAAFPGNSGEEQRSHHRRRRRPGRGGSGAAGGSEASGNAPEGSSGGAD
ncbi:MAG: hypothetical protein IJT43_10025 [Stomatobaculum sp.]|nr:hypothetical protein [Stomatobaculum sp.]